MTPKQEKALAALLTAHTMREAAQQAGIDERTLRRYLQEPEFLTEYRKVSGEILRNARMTAQQSITPALDTLRSVCADREARAGDRIAAARSLLEWAVKLTEAADFEERLTALEAAAAEKGGRT